MTEEKTEMIRTIFMLARQHSDHKLGTSKLINELEEEIFQLIENGKDREPSESDKAND